MLVIILGFAYAAIYRALKGHYSDWRYRALVASIGWGTALGLLTEILSAFHAVAKFPVAMGWLVVIALALGLGRLSAGRLDAVPPLEDEANPFLHDRATRVLAGFLVLLVVIIGVVAIVAPPNTWDAMDYHLPRVVIWMSHHSVSFFPTPNYGMLIMGPWAEYAMMHTLLLSGGDRFVNLVEFFSYLGGIVGVSYLAKLFNAGPRGQVIAAVITATIPTAVLEASGPMNTGVGAFWIICTLAVLMTWRRQPSALHSLCLGAAAGLAIFTKGTSFVILPFLVAACWWGWENSKRVLFLRSSPLILLGIIIINFAQGARCYELTGTPIGMPFPAAGTATGLLASSITPKGALANGVRLAASHFGTPSERVTRMIEHASVRAIEALGIDPDDPHTIVPGTTFHITHFSLLEVLAGNPLHLVLSAGVLILLLCQWRIDSPELKWGCVGVVLASIAFFTAVRWQPWVNRYELPIFMVLAALSGVVLERRRLFPATTLIVAVLLAGGFVFASANRIRSLIPWSRLAALYQSRSTLYFADQHEALASSHVAGAQYLKGLNCKSIGVDCYSDHQEVGTAPKTTFIYPFLAMSDFNTGVRKVQFVGLDNLTTRYDQADSTTPATVVICFGGAHIPEKWALYQHVGGRASVFGDIVIFGATGDLINTGSLPASLATGPTS